MVAVHIQIYDTYDVNGISSHVMVFTLPKPSIQPGRVVYLATEKERESLPCPGKKR